MDLILIISIAIRLAAIGWSIMLLQRTREWRLGFLPLLLGILVVRQTLGLPGEEGASATVARGQAMPALLELVVGIMAFLAVFFIDRVLTAHKQVEALLREQTRLTTLAANMDMALTETKTLQDMLGHCAELLVRHLDAAFARIWTLNEQENMLELQASAGMYTHLNGLHSRVPVGQFKIGHIAQERQPHSTNAVIGDPKEASEGTGLGLAVVHGIIADHEGAITVQSTPGQGTTFDLYFPRSDWVAVDEGAEEAPPRGKERLLFVDDEAPLVRLGQHMLERLGYEVLACTSSAEALEAFQTAPHAFDLVITDQIMPQMTGEALARALHKIRPEIPIILCTGFSHALTAEKAAALGINAYLMKPLVSRELGLAIRQVLDQCDA